MTPFTCSTSQFFTCPKLRIFPSEGLIYSQEKKMKRIRNWVIPPEADGSSGGGGSWQGSVKPSFPFTHHTVQTADRPRLRFQLPAEEFAEVSVVMQIFNSCLLHVHPKRPDVQAVNRLPEPRGQLHLVQATPGSWEQSSWYRFVQSNLKKELHHILQFFPLMAFSYFSP